MGYPGYQRSSFQRKYLDLWRPSVEILSRMCQSNSCRKNQRWRANLTVLMSSRLYQYTCWLLMNSLEASKCNWNEFRSKESFTRFPSVLVITKLSIIIITLHQYGIEIIERLSCYDSLSLILLWTFVKWDFFVLFSKHGGCFSTDGLNIAQANMFNETCDKVMNSQKLYI